LATDLAKDLAMESDESLDLPKVRDDVRGGPLGSQLILFAAKTWIVAVVFVVSFLIVAVHVENRMNQFALQMQRVTKIGGAAFWGKLEQELDRAADPQQEISDEKKQKILNDLRTITAQWKPFVNEAYSILTEAPGVPAVPTGK
jgi:hypothetical protein